MLDQLASIAIWILFVAGLYVLKSLIKTRIYAVINHVNSNRFDPLFLFSGVRDLWNSLHKEDRAPIGVNVFTYRCIPILRFFLTFVSMIIAGVMITNNSICNGLLIIVLIFLNRVLEFSHILILKNKKILGEFVRYFKIKMLSDFSFAICYFYLLLMNGSSNLNSFATNLIIPVAPFICILCLILLTFKNLKRDFSIEGHTGLTRYLLNVNMHLEDAINILYFVLIVMAGVNQFGIGPVNSCSPYWALGIKFVIVTFFVEICGAIFPYVGPNTIMRKLGFCVVVMMILETVYRLIIWSAL